LRQRSRTLSSSIPTGLRPRPTPAPTATATSAQQSVVVVTGQRAALQSAQKLKQNSDEIVDSIVAEDIGKLPDRSVTEVLQRVVGVTIDRTMSKGDPQHYSVEGSGVTDPRPVLRAFGTERTRLVLGQRRPLAQLRRRAARADGRRRRLQEPVRRADRRRVIGGLVNLRTAMPFDFKGRKVAVRWQTPIRN
jgi:iron complex outermembrane receptor protein